jgi:methylphosphotriester-DNA--protein-cysteine methyltransferase
MIYHPPGSPGAARVNPKNRILFDTPEEAEKAGFRRAHPAPERNSRSSLEILTRASWNRTGIMPQKFVPNLSIIFVSERLTAKKVALF